MSALIWASFFSLLILGLLDNVRGPFYPEILVQYMVGFERGSLFFATTSAMAFCGSLLGHRFCRLWSSQHLLMWSGLFLGIGFAIVALAQDFTQLIFACGLFGLAFGGLNFAQNLVIAEEAPVRMRRRLFSGLHSMYALAALCGPVLASLFRWVGLDWRQSFLVLSVLPLLWAGYFFFRLPRAKKVKHEDHPRDLTSTEWGLVMLYAIFIAAYLWGEISISTRMVQWLRTDLNMNPDMANFYLGSFFALFLSGRLLFSVMRFNGLNNWDILRYSSLLASVFMYLGLKVHPAFMPFAGLAMAPFYPVAIEQINTRFHDKRAQALAFVIGFGSFAVVGLHLVLGWIGEAMGVTASLVVCAGCLGAVFVALQLRGMFDTAR